uniref:UBX domain-containing protein 11 n=1 Tax=Oncorhynchus mykiss TaxID=8022 RepID=A0A8C7NDR4_ONCMY
KGHELSFLYIQDQFETIKGSLQESFVRVTSRGAQLAQQHLLPLRLYSNGILMFNGPFRSYQEASTQQCMQDLMHGYFPSDLQDRFAGGVPFRVCVCFVCMRGFQILEHAYCAVSQIPGWSPLYPSICS